MTAENSAIESRVRAIELEEAIKEALSKSAPEERIRKLEVELAERRPVERLVQILIYFLAGLSVVVGLFGFKQFSDIGSVISTEVKNQFPRDSQRYLEYRKLIDETQSLNQKYMEMYGKYESALRAFSNLDRVTDDFDIEGKVSRVVAAVEERKGAALLEEKWRLEAVATLKLLAEAQKRRNFKGDFIFNASQTAARLQQHALAAELMDLAFAKRPNDAPIQAGRLSAQVGIGDEKAVNDAFNGLMQMVANLSPNSPHIVLSEAWNAAEQLRRHAELAQAIDKLLSSNSPLKPSYAHFIRSYSLTRTGKPGDLDKAKAAMEDGVKVLSSESPNTVWFKASLREYGKCLTVFKNQAVLPRLLKLAESGLDQDEEQ